MKNFSFNVPATFNHLFVVLDNDTPKYYLDKDLNEQLFPTSNVETIDTLLPDKVSRIEMSKITTNFQNIADTINYLHLWPFSHMHYAEIIADGKTSNTFHLHNDNLKTFFRESMEEMNWQKSLFIVYEKHGGEKIGFLLFR